MLCAECMKGMGRLGSLPYVHTSTYKYIPIYIHLTCEQTICKLTIFKKFERTPANKMKKLESITFQVCFKEHHTQNTCRILHQFHDITKTEKDISTMVTIFGFSLTSSYSMPPSPPPRINTSFPQQSSLPLPIMAWVYARSLSAKSVKIKIQYSVSNSSKRIIQQSQIDLFIRNTIYIHVL